MQGEAMNISILMQKAVDYIEANLKKPLYLEDIADRANYSPWHFHRLFGVQTGMSLGDYIRKRRMSEACNMLVFTTRSIKDIAAEYQFDSQAAFCRSFKQVCGVSPGQIRKLRTPMPCFYPLRLHPKTTRGAKMIEARIEYKEAFKLVGLSCQTTMATNSIPQLWDEFNKVCDKIADNVHRGRAIGVCSSEPDVEMTEDTPFTYTAGVEVSGFENAAKEMVQKEMPGSEYAVFEHKGSLETLHETYQAIYGSWFPASEYVQTADYDFELYDERFCFGAEDSVMEIWVPVRKK